MRVKYVSENRIYWSLGRGRGDEVLGVEVSALGSDRVRRTIFSRGKYGKETTVAMEEYTAEEFLEILTAEESLVRRRCDSEKGGCGRELLLEAIEMIRRAYNEL
ncbi:MAG: hypothetical protein QFX35_05575 [Candidatus Verstraetearchaeota archaeon]|nr:hypothetical protein [Candidatus Verstraetearchaeota archaeon]